MKSNILEKIILHKKTEIAANQRRLPLSEIKVRLQELSPLTRSFAESLRRPGVVSLIAEVKRCSPSKGLIKKDFSLEETVRTYRDSRTDAISILTDKKFFGGAPQFLVAARQMTEQPLLRKDFIIDDYQIYESKLLGADAVLLIAGVLDDSELGEFIELARLLGMDVLVETRTPEEIKRAMELGATVIGINNRDLRTFRVDLSTTVEMIRYIDNPQIIVVSESGINTRIDIQTLGACGVGAVLVGESLMTSPDPRALIKEFSGVWSKGVC